MGYPVQTPLGNFVWLVSLDGVVIPPNVKVGEVCKEGERNKITVTQSLTGENGRTDVATVFHDVVSKIKLLSMAVVGGEEVKEEVLSFIEINGDEEDRLNVLRFYSQRKTSSLQMSRFSSVFLRLKSPSATEQGLKILKSMKWDIKDVLEIALKIVREGDHIQLLTRIMTKQGAETPTPPLSSDFSVGKFLASLNTLLSSPPPPSSSPLTNVMLCSCLLQSFISHLRTRLNSGDSQREQSMFLELVSMLRSDALPMLALDECCVQVARERMEKYGREMELRLRGGKEGQTELLRIFLDEVGGEEQTRAGEVEDKLLLATLLIHDAIALSSPSLSLTCATLPRLVGELDGDLERLEDAKRSRWGANSESRKDEEEKEYLDEAEKEDEKEDREGDRENRDMKLMRENPRIRNSVAIRVIAGYTLINYLRDHPPNDPDLNPDHTPSSNNSMYSPQVALNLLRSSSTSTRAAGILVLNDLTEVIPESKARAVLKTALEVCYKGGGVARMGALNYLASRSSGGSDYDFRIDVRQFLLDCGAINIVASVLEAAMEESVGEETFYVEREALRWAIREAGGDHLRDNFKGLYANNKETRGSIERHSVRLLMHMKAGGFADEVESRCEDLDDPKDLVAKELMQLVRDDDEG